MRSALFAVRHASAQRPSKVSRIGILTPASDDKTAIFDAFRRGLRDLGDEEGRTILLEFKLAKGNARLLPELAKDLVALPVDVIVTDAMSAARAAANATRSIPIVMGTSVDPVGAGLVASIARPSGNVTGMTIRANDVAGKRIHLLKQAFPGIRRVALLGNPDNPGTEFIRGATEDAAKVLGLELIMLNARTPDDLRSLIPPKLANTDGLVTLNDAMFWNNRPLILGWAAAARVPAIYPEREFVDDGGLACYGPSIPDSFRKAAGYVDRILKGVRPSDLPIDEPTKFDFVVNMRAARRLGLAPSQDFMLAVNEVID
jgi:putative tryptophan/tyrosine transport system substrate-binding protein